MFQVEEFLQEYDGGYIVTHNAEFDEVVHDDGVDWRILADYEGPHILPIWFPHFEL